MQITFKKPRRSESGLPSTKKCLSSRDCKTAKEREKHFATIKEQNRVNQKLHRLAYPERYKLTSGAALKSFRIPNTLNPFAYITTLFNGKEFDTFSYMGNDLLNQYENGDLTEHEIVNQLFSPFEQIDQSQHPPLASFLQIASGGVATPTSGRILEAPTTNPLGMAVNTTLPTDEGKMV